MAPWRAVRRYIAHPDPLAAAANLIAVVIVWNQPFYPLYIYLLVGKDIAITALTFLSTPFFLAVPALARRCPLGGRVLLPLTGIVNTVFCTKVFGEAAGIELFLAPCIMIAAMLFRRSERIVMLTLVGLGLAAYLLLHGRYGAPLHLYSSEEYTAFLGLNAVRVGSLIAFVGLTFSNALAEIETRQT